MVETFEYLEKNMDISELLYSMGCNALKALLTTIPIVGAFLAVDRILYPNMTLQGWIVLAVFLVLAVAAMVFFIHNRIGFRDIREWFFTRGMDREEMAVSVILSWFFALIGTLIAVILRDLLYTLLYLTPLSALPSLAFLYMFRLKYKGAAGPWIFWSLVYGYGFGAGLKATGMLLVLLVDVIGWQFTALGVICEILISAFYLYIDLTEWVRSDVQNKLSEEQRQAAREELEIMKEIAGRIRP